MTVTREQVLSVLQGIADPIGGGDIVSAGYVRALVVDPTGDVHFVLEVTPQAVEAMKPVRDRAEAALRALPGVGKLGIVMTAPTPARAAPPPDLKPQRPKPPAAERIPGVRRVIAVASGKGGVGKSTVAANLACALAAEGERVGLLDADVYGPSQPRMMGLSGRPESDGKTIIPLQNFGVKVMSIGFMLAEGEAVVWRGPMLMSAMQQMLFQVAWGDLDVLVVDLPPGTGDVQLSLAQKTAVDGAIVVSTPQDVALLDARKGIDMFHKLHVPILGLIENMSVHVCSNCGHQEHIFGHGGVAAEAAKMGVPLLAELPLHLSVRTAGDAGKPVVLADPESAQAEAFRDLARRLVGAGVA